MDAPLPRTPAGEAGDHSTGRLRSMFPLIPDEDLRQLARYTYGQLDSTWGLGDRPAVLVIDMTTGFVDHEGASTFVPSGRECAVHIADLLRVTRDMGLPTIYTRGNPFRLEPEAGSWLRGRGMGVLATSNSEGDREIIRSLAPGDTDPVVIKAKHSAFYGTQLNGMLNYMQVDSLIVTGVTTSGCIRATVNDAFALNYRITVPVECVADRAQISHQVELFDMAVKYADVMPLADVLAALGERSRRDQAAAP